MYRELASNDFIKTLEAKGGVFMGWYREKKSQEVEKYFSKYGLSPGYFTGAPQPWMDSEDSRTRVASAATVIDLRSGAIIYSSGTQAANQKAILDAIDQAK